MNPTVPSSTNTVSLTPGVAFITKKYALYSKCTLQRKPNKQVQVPSLKCILPLSTLFKLFPHFRIGCSFIPKEGAHITLATETDVALGEVDLSTTDNDGSETVKDDAELNLESSNKSNVIEKRSRPGKKSDMPPVKNEELIPGAIFNGKVKSIQPFGAFVDFGAFTDGLVHVSQLSDSFVKDVASVVTVGQEVKVRLVEVNMENRRISLTTRVSDNKPQQQNDAPGSDKSRPPRNGNRRKEEIKNSKFVKGQDLDGTVKNTTRSGAFITLPEGEEGFLPTSEEADEGFVSMMDGSSLEIGQEVKVRVLRINRGKVTLTMKKEEAGGQLDAKLSQGVVHLATNPFMIAFRGNKVISDFLDERVHEDVLEIKIESIKEVESSSVTLSNEGPATEDKVTEGSYPTEEKESEEESMLSVDATEETESKVSEEIIDQLIDVTEEVKGKPDEDIIAEDEDQNEKPDIINSSATLGVEESDDLEETDSNGAHVVSPEVETEIADRQVIVEDTENKESVIDSSSRSSDASPKEDTVKAAISPALVKQLRDETGAGMMDCKKALSETEGDILKAQEYLRKKGLASADKKSSRATAEGRIGSYIHDSRIGVLIEVNCETDFVARGDIFKELVEDLAMQVAACPQVQYLSTDDIPKEMIDKETEIEMQKEDLLSKPEQIRSKIVEGRIKKRMEELALLDQTFIKDDKVVVKDWVKQTISTIGENIKVKRFVRYNLGEGLEKKSQDFAAEVAAQTASKPTATTVVQEPVATEAKESIEKPQKAVVSAALVKQLRNETGAGMMDCKKALAETAGDLEKAVEFLRKKGLSTADKKSSRLAAEGRIGSYIHDSRIGVLIEVNCETDFVGRSENFKKLVDDLAMQVVACPQVQHVSVEDIPENTVSREKQLEMQREDLQSKPENIREKIVEGRIGKRLGELVLLEQTFIKDDSLLVKDLVKQTVAGLGENIKVRRFVRFTLGESRDAESVTEA